MTAWRSLNEASAALLVEELVRNGVDTFCYASGSRSSPLVVAAARHPRARGLVHVDERGVGFYAVGHARAVGRPAAVITTSGTAAANLLPAVIEARQAHLPLILLTADRSPELRDTGANQTMRQPHLYGDYVRWDADMPCPGTDVPAAYVLSTVDQACHAAGHPAAGPVHLNCMFREPLAPDPDGADVDRWLAGLEEWHEATLPHTRVRPPDRLMPPSSRQDVAAALSAARRGVVVIGELGDHVSRDACLALVDSLSWPAFPDVSSGLRLDGRSAALIPYYDVLLTDPSRLEGLDTVLHVGGRFMSRRWQDALAARRAVRLIHLAEHSERLDPTHQVGLRVEARLADACLQLCAESFVPRDPDWTSQWREASQRVAEALTVWDDESPELEEPWIARRVAADLPEGWGLAVASSMPVRDLNRFASSRAQPVPIACNRGVSGIDGTVATAAGFSDALHRPVTLLTGDLALLHDLNSLQLVRRARRPMIIVAVNNDGGGIFHFLPIHRHPDVFETHFGTPHGLSFRSAAEMYRLDYAAPESRSAFTRAFREALASDNPTLIEVRTRRDRNLAVHQALDARLLRRARGE